MENLQKRYNILVAILMLFTLLFTIIFATLSYYKYRYETEPIIITTTSLNVNVTSYNVRNNDNIQPTLWSNNMVDNENNSNIAKVDLKVNTDPKVNGIYEVKLKSAIEKNNIYVGGEISDIKYKVYKEGNFVSEGTFDNNTDKKIIDGIIKKNITLNDIYNIYIYIEETGQIQDTLRDISFDFKFEVEATQTD